MMEFWSVCAVFNGIVIVLQLFHFSESRQVCFACQYNDNPAKQGYKCITEPRNWTMGYPVTKCKQKCIITSHIEKDTDKVIYMFRGCGDGYPENVCEDGGAFDICYFTCEEHYCNVGLGGGRVIDDYESTSDRLSFSPLILFAFPNILMFIVR